MSPHYQIAIDGPAGAGKSTVAKRIAERLNIRYLDTGAMYRALALYAQRRGVDGRDEAAVKAILPDAAVAVRYTEEDQRVLLLGEDVTARLRAPELSMGASDISAHRCVREHMTLLQRRVAAEYPVVMDGRDITTNVLKDSPYKFYLTATPEERARRRMDDMLARGQQPPAFETLLAEIKTRDRNDSMRAYMPLCVAPDAHVIDTTNLSVDEVVETVLAWIAGKGLA